MGSKLDKVATGVSVRAKIVVNLLWLAGGIACVAAGAWCLGLIAIAYLVYLWLFGGTRLTY